MSTIIKCPRCGNEFEPTETLREEVKKELRDEMKEWQRKKEEALNAQIVEEKKGYNWKQSSRSEKPSVPIMRTGFECLTRPTKKTRKS